MTLAYRAALLIPHYNHHRQFAPTLERIVPLALPMIVVDDGSEAESRASLRTLLGSTPDTTLIEHDQNQGKGAALITGFAAATAAGFSHVVQVDADGQHALEDIPKLLKLSRRNPEAIVSAKPVFAADIPRERRVGRRLTDFWVAVETLSRRVEDAMCGLRVYPIEAVQGLTRRYRMGQRMQFDIEVLVRADWAGIPILYRESQVRYPEDGLSHFDYWRDNRDITLMHTRLVLGMLPRIPRLLQRHLRS